MLHTCQQTATTKSPESTSACVSLPVYYIYLPVCIEKKTKKKQPTKAAGAFSCLDDCLLTSSLLNPVFLSAAASGLRACKMFPLICLYTCSACLWFFFFFFIPPLENLKLWLCYQQVHSQTWHTLKTAALALEFNIVPVDLNTKQSVAVFSLLFSSTLHGVSPRIFLNVIRIY